MAKSITRYLPVLALALALPSVAQAADSNAAVSKQVATAAAHAGMSLGAADLATAQAHLHHVVNCLVGPDGKGFDAKAADPCKGMGNGAIVDAKGDAAAESKLHKALSEAWQGLKATTLASTHADAQKVMNTLQAK